MHNIGAAVTEEHGEMLICWIYAKVACNVKNKCKRAKQLRVLRYLTFFTMQGLLHQISFKWSAFVNLSEIASIFS